MMTLHPSIEISPQDIEKLKNEARHGPRRRAALPIHKDFADPVQRVLMAANPDTYVGPHLHPDKLWEMVVLLEGALDILLFSKGGVVEKRVSLSKDQNCVFEYPANQFHAAIVLEPDTLVLEVKEGPYIAETAKELPSWAPEENAESAPQFNQAMEALKVGDCVKI